MTPTDAVRTHLAALGLDRPGPLYVNLPTADLTRRALDRDEGRLSEHGVFVGFTSPHTGRSPDDRFVVDTPDVHDEVGWN